LEIPVKSFHVFGVEWPFGLNKSDAPNGSKRICRVFKVSSSPSGDLKRYVRRCILRRHAISDTKSQGEPYRRNQTQSLAAQTQYRLAAFAHLRTCRKAAQNKPLMPTPSASWSIRSWRVGAA
jgi:hypothetical protein